MTQQAQEYPGESIVGIAILLSEVEGTALLVLSKALYCLCSVYESYLHNDVLSRSV